MKKFLMLSHEVLPGLTQVVARLGEVELATISSLGLNGLGWRVTQRDVKKYASRDIHAYDKVVVSVITDVPRLPVRETDIMGLGDRLTLVVPWNTDWRTDDLAEKFSTAHIINASESDRGGAVMISVIRRSLLECGTFEGINFRGALGYRAS